VQAALVVEGAERNAVARRIGAPGGAELEMMIGTASWRQLSPST
jgi:hypothetical protein